MISHSIAVIGCRNLGKSIVNGLLEKGMISADKLIVTRRNTKALKELEDKGVKVTSDNATALKEASLIIIALKPYTILQELSRLK